ncbi:MAG: hypothetical protein HQL08_00870 [Nitrospirae bacterium]|nr:hypothetical protein [Nitrospirota bacterium]
MKNRAAVILAIAILACFMGACSRKASFREYAVDKVCDTEPRVRITKITVTDKDTRVNFKYEYKSRSASLQPGTKEALTLAPPGNADALTIVADGSGRKYLLLRVEGIPTLPDHVFLQEGSVVEFILIFERLDDTVRKINIVEKATGMDITWQFLNIQLQ